MRPLEAPRRRGSLAGLRGGRAPISRGDRASLAGSNRREQKLFSVASEQIFVGNKSSEVRIIIEPSSA